MKTKIVFLIIVLLLVGIVAAGSSHIKDSDKDKTIIKETTKYTIYKEKLKKDGTLIDYKVETKATKVNLKDVIFDINKIKKDKQTK
jgi:hypothetical protein